MVATRTYTVEELERTPPAGNWAANDWELVDGEVVVVTPTGGKSGRTPIKLGFLLGGTVYAEELGQLYGPETGFKLFPDRETLLAPDLSFVRTDRLPPADEEHTFLRLAPDLAVEVRSPSDSWSGMLAKAAIYLEAGVPVVWLIDPNRRTVTILTPEAFTLTLGEGDVLDGGDVVPGFAVPVAAIFA